MPTKKINFDVFRLCVINDAGEDINFEPFLLKKLDKYDKVLQGDSPVVLVDGIKQIGNFIGKYTHLHAIEKQAINICGYRQNKLIAFMKVTY